MSHHPHAARRAKLLDLIGDGIAVLPTAPEKIRNRDAHHPYRYDSYFWYLTGFPEPDAVLVLLGGEEPQSILFCREKNEEREIWDGYRHGPAGAVDVFGFDAAHPIAEFETKLVELLADRNALWYALGHDAAWDARITSVLNAVRAQTRAGKRAPGEIRDLRMALDTMRLTKDAYELGLMRQAAAISSAGHARAMRACKSGMAEYELEAELSYEFRRRSAQSHAYTPIVASGINACVLHYVANDKLLNDHELVLIDAGCEVEGYASDITRTFPINGKFSASQRDCYEIVLAAQTAAIEATKPNNHFLDPHQAALRVLAQGMLDLKLLEGTVDGVLESESYKRFYMHRTGHWLGLDVHDAGEYKTGDAWTTLAPGMTLTVEPELYIRPGHDIPSELAGIGIRIEDDVLVTSQGREVYTSAPRLVAEIEEVMRHD